MASREIRRRKDRKGEKPDNIVEEKKIKHPMLYLFSVVILVIIVVTFIGSPAINKVGGAGRIVFGTYGGTPIEYAPGNYFARQRDMIAEQVRQQQQNQQQSEEAVQMMAYQVWRSAFDQTVSHVAILQTVQKSGLWITEDRVDRALIRSGPYVVNGRFSEEAYNNTSAAERYTTRKLFREQLIQEQYLQDLFNGLLPNQKESDFFAGMADPERSFNYVTWPLVSYPDKEVIAYGEQNRDKFRRVKLSRILVKSGKAEAEAIHKKLVDKTSSFEELARAHSKDAFAEKGGDMGSRYQYDVTQDFEKKEPVDLIFQLAAGAISPVLESKYGWAIYRADEAATSPDPQDSDTLKVVRDYLMRYERGKVSDWFLAQARDFDQEARRDGLQKAAAARGLAAHATEAFPVNYQGVFITAPVQAAKGVTVEPGLTAANYSEEFFQKTFALKAGEVSDPVPLEDQVLVLELKEEKPLTPEQKTFMGTYYQYFDGQTTQSDLQEHLIDPARLVDNFNTVFGESTNPRSASR